MNARIRPALVVAAGFLLPVCIFGSRLACDPAGLREFIQGIRRAEQLQRFERSMGRHHEARLQVMREVIVQRCSLNEGLARLRELDHEWLQEVEREWPDSAIGIAQSFRLAWSDADTVYRGITALASELRMDQPEEAAAVLQRLEKDYRQLQASRQTPATAPMEQAGPSR